MPTSWNIVQVSGDAAKGYWRADGPGERSLEVRWERMKRHPDLEYVASQYLKQVQRVSKKQNIEYDGGLKTSEGTSRKRISDLRFRWQADRCGIGRLVWCPDCRRALIVQVSGPRSVSLEASGRMLESIHDHTYDTSTVEWGVYGISFRIPERLKLARQRLMSGFLSLNFGNLKERVIVERWGLAEMLMTDGGFLGWHEKEYLAELSKFRGDTHAGEHGSHETLETEGVEGGLRGLIATLRGWGIPSWRERFASIVWECPETNRIVGVRAFGRRPRELAAAVAASVRCHGQ